jgi:choline dehydrogenase-like flavoprotein
MAAEQADVLVIGAGPAGGVLADRLVAAGMTVVCLEQGDWPDRDAYRGAYADAELAGRRQFSANPNVRRGVADYPIDLAPGSPNQLLVNGVGGSTQLFMALWPRMTPDDFRRRSNSGVAEDWPLTYEELAPYYARTDVQMGVSGLEGSPAYPSDLDYPMPPMPVPRGGLRVARAFAKLGWHWWPDANAIASVPYRGRHVCARRSTCNTGCNEGAKASADLTHWRPLVGRGCTVVTGATVTRILLDAAGLAAGAEWIDRGGALHVQPARLVVCAAGGIGNARLLLLSRSSMFPDGLANRSGLVGRGLMIHPGGYVIGWFDEDLKTWRGHNGSWLTCMEYYKSDPTRGFVGGCRWSFHPTGGPLATVLPGPGRGVWGVAQHHLVKERLGRGVAAGVMGEDFPEDHNRVDLSHELTDSVGLPAPRVTYRMSDNSRRMLDWNIERAVEMFEAAEASRIEVVPFTGQNGHQMGTTRMGNDPERSVVDRWGRSHDVPNLFIVGAGVFVTGAAANPTSTLCALSLRTADHIVESRRSIPAPSAPGISTRVFAVNQSPRRPENLGVEPFTPSERAKLDRLSLALIPAGAGMPSAVDVGISDTLLDKVIAVRPDIAADLHRALSIDVGDPERAIADLRVADVEACAALELAVAGGYYMHAKVRALIGYDANDPKPAQRDPYPDYIAEGLLDHLADR